MISCFGLYCTSFWILGGILFAMMIDDSNALLHLASFPGIDSGILILWKIRKRLYFGGLCTA